MVVMGSMDTAFEYNKQNGGLAAESNYPYKGQDGVCEQQTETAAQITGFKDVTRNDEQALKNAVSRQPVSVAIAASGDHFQNFKGDGIFQGYCGDSLNRAVTIVGYGNENGMDYWLIKNSWGKLGVIMAT